MPSLEDEIRQAAARGLLTHLSVAAIGGGFSATFAPAVGNNRFGEDRDPVEALRKALNNTTAPRRVRVTKPNEDDEIDFG